MRALTKLRDFRIYVLPVKVRFDPAKDAANREKAQAVTGVR